MLARSADGFVFLPLALLVQTGWLPRMASGVIAAVVLLVVPIVWRRLPACAWGRRLEACATRRNVIYPLIALLYPLVILHGTPLYTYSIFEDSHSLRSRRRCCAASAPTATSCRRTAS